LLNALILNLVKEQKNIIIDFVIQLTQQKILPKLNKDQ